MVKIGVAVPTYNRENQLGGLLEMIPAHIPVYVSDNGSHLTAPFKKRFPSVHFKSIAGEPLPPLTNWNLAARMVTEDWVVIPSDDDIYYEDSFNTIEEYLERYNSADIVVFGHNTVDEEYQRINEWKPRELVQCAAPNGFDYFKYGVDARMPSIFFKKKLLEELGYFDESFKITAGDSDLVQRALIKGISVFVPIVVSGYRVWEQGSTHQTIGTFEWMQEIDYWGDKLEKTLQEIPQYASQVSEIRAEIYARNLLAGIASVKKSRGYIAAWKHMMRCKYPHKALLRTQRRLLYGLIRP